MSLFSKLTTTGLEESKDFTSSFSCLDSSIYVATIKALYAGKSNEGATSVTLLADINGKDYSETFYVTNRNGENWFLNKKDPTKKVPLPGFTTVDDICLIATGKPLSEQDTEDKVIKVWDFSSRSEKPKAVPMITDAIGKTVALGVIKEIVDKMTKQGTTYVPSGESREQNVTEKVFHPEHKITVVEARKGLSEGTYWDTWLEKNQGAVKDKRKGVDAVKPTATKPNTPTAAPRKSLFDK